ncbi:MAG TPA: hypothetical protein VLB32_06555 [Candidatus Acidoferrales bacterium]|nr:hypothetical protein [Candidatus Acidoferrales bacterium]
MKPTDIIQVKYSEDLAQFADVRPVRRQPMSLHELVGLVLTATGKHPERVRQRLRSGTCPYNIYRYWWEGFEIEDTALAAVLAEFPDADPSRPFRLQTCLWARLSDSSQPVAYAILIEKDEAAAKRWFRRQNFWESLMDSLSAKQLSYQEYSYFHRADIYRTDLTAEDRSRVAAEAQRLARRGLRERLLQRSADWARLELACGRE